MTIWTVGQVIFRLKEIYTNRDQKIFTIICAVSRYEVRYSTVFEAVRDAAFAPGGSYDSVLIDELNDIVNGSLQPLESGSQQSATFLLIFPFNRTMNATNYYVALRAVDKAGNFGPASNVASLQLTSREEPDEPLVEDPSGLSTKAIVGIALGSLLAVFLIIFVVCLIVRRRYQSYRQTETNPKA